VLVDRVNVKVLEEPAELRRNDRAMVFGQGLLTFIVALAPPIFHARHEV
jgi:hypothetical protein